MDIKPVIIDIDDKRLFAQIAFLVDRPDFLKEIQDIRQEYDIDPELQADGYFETASDDELSQLQQKSDIYRVAARIRQKYKYPPYFDDIIVQVILFHKVHSTRQTKVVTHLAKAITPRTSKPDLSENHLEMSIHITPLSTKKEVLEAFEESKKLRSEYMQQHPLLDKLDKRALNNIVRDRNWYLQVKKDGNYLELLKKWNERPNVHEYKMFHKGTQRCGMCYIEDDNYVHQAVFEYRKLIK